MVWEGGSVLKPLPGVYEALLSTSNTTRREGGKLQNALSVGVINVTHSLLQCLSVSLLTGPQASSFEGPVTQKEILPRPCPQGTRRLIKDRHECQQETVRAQS